MATPLSLPDTSRAVRPLRLVKPRPLVDADTVQTLETLLEVARNGQATGLVFGVRIADGSFITDITGSCMDSPTMTLGMLSFVSDQVKTLQHNMDPGKPR